MISHLPCRRKERNMRMLEIFVCFIVVIGTCAAVFGADSGIDIFKGNPRYWQYNGKPVLLLGGSDEDNLFNDPGLMKKDLDLLPKCGGNYIRGTLSFRDKNNVVPFLKTGNLYDLNKFNPEFFDRLEHCLAECERRGIVVQIEIWATFDYYRDLWERNPFNPAANCNYSAKETKLPTKWNFHPAARPQPFFFTPINGDKVTLKYQEAFVRKVLEITLNHNNVLYCMDNETRAPAQWGLYWARFIRAEAKKRNKKVHTTEMWDPWNLHDKAHANTYDHRDVYSFTDVSQNNWQSGQTHYDRLIWYRRNLIEHGGVRPMNNVKIYGLPPGGKVAVPALNIDRFWKVIFAGCASARFHRPPAGLGLGDLAQQTIRAARTFTNAFDIFASEPRTDLILDRQSDEAYCLAKPGEFYALYFPRGGKVRLRLNGEKAVTVSWFDPVTCKFSDPKRETTTGFVTLENRSENVRLALVRKAE